MVAGGQPIQSQKVFPLAFIFCVCRGVEFNVVKVFVGGLPASVDTEMLKGYFEKYGNIEVRACRRVGFF